MVEFAMDVGDIVVQDAEELRNDIEKGDRVWGVWGEGDDKNQTLFQIWNSPFSIWNKVELYRGSFWLIEFNIKKVSLHEFLLQKNFT